MRFLRGREEAQYDPKIVMRVGLIGAGIVLALCLPNAGGSGSDAGSAAVHKDEPLRTGFGSAESSTSDAAGVDKPGSVFKPEFPRFLHALPGDLAAIDPASAHRPAMEPV